MHPSSLALAARRRIARARIRATQTASGDEPRTAKRMLLDEQSWRSKPGRKVSPAGCRRRAMTLLRPRLYGLGDAEGAGLVDASGFAFFLELLDLAAFSASVIGPSLTILASRLPSGSFR